MHARKLTTALLFVLALGSIVLAYHSGHPLRDHLFNSDALYIPTVLADVLRGGGRLADWYLTPAPYFFPDYLLYLPAYLLGASIYDQVLIFALLQVAAIGGAVFLIAGAVLGRDRAAVATLACVALTSLALTVQRPYVELLSSAFHYGAFLAGLVFVALWLRLQTAATRRARRLLLAGMLLVTFATALSDNLFLVQVVAPFVLAVPLAAAQPQPWRVRLAESSLILGAGVAGSAAYGAIVARSTRYPNSFGFGQVPANLDALLGQWWEAIAALPPLGLVLLGYAACCAASIRSCLRGTPVAGAPPALAWLTCFSLLSALVTSATVLLLTNLPVVPRYHIPDFSWPVIIVALWAAHLARQHFQALAMGTSAVLLALAGTGIAALTPEKATGPRTYYPAEIACIDRAVAATRAQHGIAQYWDAKRIRAFSRQPYTLAQYLGNLSEHRWITSSKLFRQRYDFAIIDEGAPAGYKLDKQKLVRINGAPSRVVACGNKTVLLYPKDAMVIRHFAAMGDAQEWKGCELPTRIATRGPRCSAEKTDPATEGFLTFGPYQELPPGRYAFRLDYASSQPRRERTGGWDVMRAGPGTPRELAKGDLAGTGNTTRRVEGSFRLDAADGGGVVEIRTYASRGGTMRVERLWIVRID